MDDKVDDKMKEELEDFEQDLELNQIKLLSPKIRMYWKTSKTKLNFQICSKSTLTMI